jgi:cyclic beta-1,2-glucan synthetase
MYRLGLESILGLRRRGGCFSIAPCVPRSWEGFRVRWSHETSVYEIRVENPGHRNRGVAAAVLDGVHVEPQAIPLIDDGATHRLEVIMGEFVPAQG